MKKLALPEPQTQTQLGGKSFAFVHLPVVELGGIALYDVSAELTYMVVGSAPVKGAAAKALENAKKQVEKGLRKQRKPSWPVEPCLARK